MNQRLCAPRRLSPRARKAGQRAAIVGVARTGCDQAGQVTHTSFVYGIMELWKNVRAAWFPLQQSIH
jgi:hypothetical protein